jgi:hypothetical protein
MNLYEYEDEGEGEVNPNDEVIMKAIKEEDDFLSEAIKEYMKEMEDVNMSNNEHWTEELILYRQRKNEEKRPIEANKNMALMEEYINKIQRESRKLPIINTEEIII